MRGALAEESAPQSCQRYNNDNNDNTNNNINIQNNDGNTSKHNDKDNNNDLPFWRGDPIWSCQRFRLFWLAHGHNALFCPRMLPRLRASATYIYIYMYIYTFLCIHYIYIYVYVYIYIYIYIYKTQRVLGHAPDLPFRGGLTAKEKQITVPQKGYAKRASKKRLLLSDLKVT